MDHKELERLIPSETVREYVKETGWTFTDFQKASLLYNRGLLMKDEYTRLKELGERTSDYILQKQIADYLGGMEGAFRSFQESDRHCIYVLKVREEGGWWDGEYLACGYFSDWRKALAYGKKEKAPFEIEKYTADDVDIFEDGTCTCHPDTGMRFDKDGEADYLWGCKETAVFDNEYFTEAFFEVPNPFERGDIVKTIWGSYGIVAMTQETWKEKVEKHKGWKCAGYCDNIIGVDIFDEETGFFCPTDSISPLDLERYQPEPKVEDWTNGSMDTLLVCARDIYCDRGYLSTLFYYIEKYQSGC